MRKGNFSSGVKPPEREANHSFPPSFGDKKAYSYTRGLISLWLYKENKKLRD
jgi:hypothetical protein